MPGSNVLPIDAPTYKQVLSRWASGITVVTCCRPDGGPHGMTASSFAGVSLDPPLVLVCVGTRNKTHQFIIERQAFGVVVLSPEMRAVSDRCAGFQGEEAHELDDLAYRVEVSGAPILEGALAWLDCRLWRRYEAGDHSIFVGEVLAAGSREGEPLLWYHRGYRQLSG